jgi:uncharacterized protein
MIATDNQIKGIIEKIVISYKPDKIWLFGSYSNNTQNINSDIDLLIIKDTATKVSKRASEIHRLFNPYIFDLDILVYTPDEFENQKNNINTIAYFINREGKIVYEQST